MADTSVKKPPSTSILKKPTTSTANESATKIPKSSTTKIPKENSTTEVSKAQESTEDGPTTETEEIVTKEVVETEEVTTKVTQEESVVKVPKEKKDKGSSKTNLAPGSEFDAPSERSGGDTVVAFKKDEFPGTRSSQTIMSPPPLRYADSKNEHMNQANQANQKPLVKKKFAASLVRFLRTIASN